MASCREPAGGRADSKYIDQKKSQVKGRYEKCQLYQLLIIWLDSKRVKYRQKEELGGERRVDVKARKDLGD